MSSEVAGHKVELERIAHIDGKFETRPEEGDERLSDQIGVPNCEQICAFVRALIAGTTEQLNAARDELRSKLGASAVLDCSTVGSRFDALNRIANATGLELDDTLMRMKEAGTEQFSALMREETGFGADSDQG